MQRRNFLKTLPLAATALATLFRSNSLAAQPELRTFTLHKGKLVAGRAFTGADLKAGAITPDKLATVYGRHPTAGRLMHYGADDQRERFEDYWQRKATEESEALLYSETEPTILNRGVEHCSLSVRRKG